MKREISTRFYTFNQNNSGGSFKVERENGISETVIIEAQNADEANDRAEEIGLYFNGCTNGRDCSCCGDRWYRVDEGDADQVPSLYGDPISERKAGWFRNKIFVHYYDGKVEEIDLPE